MRPEHPIVLITGASSGFGEAMGIAHFRTTILLPTDNVQNVVEALGEFQRSYR